MWLLPRATGPPPALRSRTIPPPARRCRRGMTGISAQRTAGADVERAFQIATADVDRVSFNNASVAPCDQVQIAQVSTQFPMPPERCRPAKHARGSAKVMLSRRSLLQSSAGAVVCVASGTWAAKAANAPGVTDTEIKIGQTMPYSGPASAYGVNGRTEVAYCKMTNEMGGVNGRKLNLISLDDGLSSAQNGRANPPSYRAGAGRLHLRDSGHGVKCGDPALSQR